MHINVKFPTFNLEIEIEGDASVEQLRTICAEKINSSPSSLCLVYNGKIMKDHDKLSNLGIFPPKFFDVRDGVAIHCALRKPATPTQSEKATPLTQPSISQAQPSPAPMLPQTVQVATNITAQQNPLLGLHNQATANVMRAITDSPELSRLFSDPAFIDTMVSLDPRLKSLLDNYPEIAQGLRNPEVMRSVGELMRNPQAFQEAARSQERMLSSLQNTPNGWNQYLRLFTDLNRIMNPNSSTPAAATSNTQAQSDSTNANVVGEAMPNPWGTTAPLANPTSHPVASSTSATTQAPSSASDNPLFRDVIRVLSFSGVDPGLNNPIVERIRSSIDALSPRGQYGLAEYVKGMETLKEESVELVVLLINYQISSLQFLSQAPSDISQPQQDDQIPPDSGTQDTYQAQLTELQGMGFDNNDENLEALRFAYGNVSGAVNWLLRKRGFQ